MTDDSNEQNRRRKKWNEVKCEFNALKHVAHRNGAVNGLQLKFLMDYPTTLELFLKSVVQKWKAIYLGNLTY